MALYLPGPENLLAVLIAWGVGAVLLCGGTAIAGRGPAPEFRVVAGWGALCVVLTLWGVFVPASLRIPAIACVVAGLAAQLAPGRRVSRPDAVALGRLLLVTLPLWVVMAGVRPSQVDTFLNLLPNADYLVDYGRLPTAALPPSHSFLPAAPYDTQFLAFLGALVWPDFPAPGMALVNVLLRIIAGLAIARLLMRSADAPPSWGATALGMLLVTLFDPGFVPRFHFSPYGETGLAVTALLAGCLIVDGQSGRGRHLLAVSLILAAMINTKQSGIGLVLAVALAGLVLAGVERGADKRRALVDTALALIPAAVLYVVWRYYAEHAGVAELETLPLSAWNWSLLPAMARSIARAIAAKPLFFVAEGVSFALLAALLRRRGWIRATRLLAFNAAAFVLYNGFLVATYIAHFSPEMATEAHSYFRYNTHLSLLLMASLAVGVCEFGASAWSGARGRWLAVAVVLVALVAPVGFAERLRFDIEMPQPLVWDLAAELKPLVKDGDRMAMLLPGDDSEIGTLLGDYLIWVPPRRRDLDILVKTTADTATLAAVAGAGYDLAVISCVPEGMGLPAGQAALLRHDGDGWRVLASWPYAPAPALSHWQHNRHWPALCR